MLEGGMALMRSIKAHELLNYLHFGWNANHIKFTIQRLPPCGRKYPLSHCSQAASFL